MYQYGKVASSYGKYYIIYGMVLSIGYGKIFFILRYRKYSAALHDDTVCGKK